MNSVQALLNQGTLSYDDKLEIKRLGPDRPELMLEQVTKCKKREYRRKFNASTYSNYKWLCGCPIRNALFCFPCLIFSKELNAWTKTGFRDISHLSSMTKKHETTHAHKNACIELSLLGRSNIQAQLDSAYRLSIKKHNEQVEKNRHILSRLIDCVKFCGVFELALRGHDESESSDNPGVFRGLVNFVSSIDAAMKEHLDSATVFKGTSKTVQNEILDCMLEVCRETISEEIKNANYLAIMADETTDVATVQQMVIIYRYEIGGQPVERFWGFFNPDGQNAEALSEVVIGELTKQIGNQTHKLIAQCYDGAAVMSGAANGVQARVKQIYSQAYYIHCYAHQFNLVLQKASSINSSARIFFSNLSGFPVFFSRSTLRTKVLDDIVQQRLPRLAQTRWMFNIRTVNAVYENKEALIECLDEISHLPNIDDTTRRESCGLLAHLEDEQFLYWLEFFHRIMPHADILFKMLQQRNIDAVKVNHCITSFKLTIETIRNTGVDSMEKRLQETAHIPPRKRRREEHRTSEAKEVCDAIICHINDRFAFTNHLVSSRLVDVNLFPSFAKIFPEKELEEAVRTYPSLVKAQLRTELEVLYSRSDFHKADGAVAMLQILIENNLHEDTFQQLSELLRIIVTTPMTSSEPERCFSTLKRIKTFLRNTMTEDRLSALAMLAVEKKLVNNIRDFNNKVIDKFAATKTRRMDFLYK